MSSAVDIFVVVCSLFALGWGAYKGFTSQIFSIIGLILGIWAASKFTPVVASWIGTFIGNSPPGATIKILTYIVLFIVIIVVCHIIGNAIEGVINLTILASVNRLLGAIFALLKVLLLLAAIACIINYAFHSMSFVEQLRNSKAFLFLLNFADSFFPYLKELFAEVAA